MKGEFATDIEVSGVGFRHIVTTRHGNISARTAIHTNSHQKRLGGVRFVERGSIEEVAHLAIGMTEKAEIAEVPIDGLKCLIECPDGIPSSPASRAALIAEHLDYARQVDPGVIFGPDMLAPEAVLSLVAADNRLAKHVTGLSRLHGGIDIDGNGLTAFGVREAIEVCREQDGAGDANIQGFGAVGAELACLLADDGYRITTLCNSQGLIRKDEGLDVVRYRSAWREQGDKWIASVRDPGVRYSDEIRDSLTHTCDVLIPTARTSVIATAAELERVSRENPGVVAAEHILEQYVPDLIVEAANHPLTENAERLFEDNAVCVLPDVVINCGGMIGCWYEYENRDVLLADVAHYDKALFDCLARIREVISFRTRSILATPPEENYVRDLVRNMSLNDPIPDFPHCDDQR